MGGDAGGRSRAREGHKEENQQVRKGTKVTRGKKEMAQRKRRPRGTRQKRRIMKTGAKGHKTKDKDKIRQRKTGAKERDCSKEQWEELTIEVAHW